MFEFGSLLVLLLGTLVAAGFVLFAAVRLGLFLVLLPLKLALGLAVGLVGVLALPLLLAVLVLGVLVAVVGLLALPLLLPLAVLAGLVILGARILA